MNDRELIDNAAKAAKDAGMCLLYSGSTDEGESYWHYDFRRWDPLTDDGDALRLAVNLGIDVDFYKSTVEAGREDIDHIAETCGECALETTRRAIVRAAAAIGAAL
jgi:hypothetical protein